jgi:hypothetical protein
MVLINLLNYRGGAPPTGGQNGGSDATARTIMHPERRIRQIDPRHPTHKPIFLGDFSPELRHWPTASIPSKPQLTASAVSSKN